MNPEHLCLWLLSVSTSRMYTTKRTWTLGSSSEERRSKLVHTQTSFRNPKSVLPLSLSCEVALEELLKRSETDKRKKTSDVNMRTTDCGSKPVMERHTHTHTQSMESYLIMGLKSARVVLERCTLRIFAPLLQTSQTRNSRNKTTGSVAAPAHGDSQTSISVFSMCSTENSLTNDHSRGWRQSSVIL